MIAVPASTRAAHDAMGGDVVTEPDTDRAFAAPDAVAGGEPASRGERVGARDVDGVAGTLSTSPDGSVSLPDVAAFDGDVAAEPPSPLRRALRRVTLADALRLVGGGALALALVDFLLTGVAVQNDLQRFLLLLLQTGLFAGGAFALDRAFCDTRGARLLLGIALLSVPAGFTVLGAMLYAAVPLDGGDWLRASGWLRGDADDGSVYPGFAHWQASGLSDIVVAGGAALLALVPTTLFGMAVMARRASPWLAPAFLASAATLLVPVRDPSLIAPLVVASSLALGWLLARRGHGDATLATAEGRFARAVLFVPPAILVARGLVMYPPDALLGLALCVLVYALFRWTSIVAGATTRLQGLLYPLASLAAVAVAVNLALFASGALGLWVVPLATLVGALLVVELRRHVAARRLWLAVEGMLALGALALLYPGSLFAAPDGEFVLPGALAAATVLGYAVLTRRIVIGALSGLCLALMIGPAIGEVLDAALRFVAAHGWQSLVAAGLLAVVGAAALERHGGTRRRNLSARRSGAEG